MVAFTEMDLLGGPPITEPVLTLDTIKTLVDTFKLFTNISHVSIDRVVSDKALHCRVHESIVGNCVPRRAN